MRSILILLSLVSLAYASNINLLMCTPFQKDSSTSNKKERITIFNSKSLKEEPFGIFKTTEYIKAVSIKNTQEDREAISNILLRQENFIYKETNLDTRTESDGTRSDIKIILYTRSGSNPRFPERFTLEEKIKDDKVYYYARHLRLVSDLDLSVIHSLCKDFK